VPYWLTFTLLAVTGFVSGALNIVAGGGSFLTLPMLIFVGLPPSVANGTNRIGVLLQNVGGVWGFHRHGVLEWTWGLQVSAPAVVGAALGAWLALQVGDVAFRRILASVMVVASLWPILSSPVAPVRQRPRDSVIVLAGFFLAGVYGGFLQAGVGFLILALTSASGLDLVRGNAVKVLSVLLLTALSLAVFAWHDRVDWALGLILGLGNLSGAFLGVRLAVLKGHRWIRTVVTLAVVVFAVRLWFL
jgi:uncharacterized membrane protein YfcA